MIAPSYHATLQRLAQQVDQSSRQIWENSARRYHHRAGRLQHNETTTTDTFLTSLEENGVIEFYQFSSKEESRLGADWEWWIGSNTIGWACARIQAKRAYPGTATGVRAPRGPEYRKLAHEVGTESQMKLLIDGCQRGLRPDRPKRPDTNLRDGVIRPYYAFYNGWPCDAFDDNEDVASIEENDLVIAEHASRRTDRPLWGDWAQTRLLHYASCPPQMTWSESPTRWSFWHHSECPVPLPRFIPELLPFWGISALPALDVRRCYETISHSKQALTYFAESLPISTVMFDLWTSLTSSSTQRRTRVLPDYADAIRLLGDPEHRDESIDRLERIRANTEAATALEDDTDQGFPVPAVAVTDAGPQTRLG